MFLGTANALFEGAVGLVSLILTILTFIAYRRTGLPNARFVISAFALNAIKSSIVAYSLYSEAVEHQAIELLDGAGDVVVIVLLVIPYFRRSGGASRDARERARRREHAADHPGPRQPVPWPPHA